MFHKKYSVFIKQVASLISGTALAQLIQIAASPFLTRVYLPAEFGIYAVYMGLISIISICVSFRYELAILIPESNEEAVNIFVVSLMLPFIFSLLLLVILLVFIKYNLIPLKLHSHILLFYISPLHILIIGLFNCVLLWLNRFSRFFAMSFLKISLAVANLIIAFLYAFYFHLSSYGLIYASFFSHFIVSIIFILYIIAMHRNLFSFLKISKIFEILHKYADFPKYYLLSGLIEGFAKQLPTILLSALFGNKVAGYYNLSQRVIRRPLIIISKSVGDVFKQKASQLINQTGQCHDLFKFVVGSLALIITIPFLLFALFSPDIFKLFFGTEWELSGIFTQILFPMYFLQFITNPVSPLFYLTNNQRIHLIINILILLLLFISFAFSYLIDNYYTALFFITIAFSIKYASQFYFNRLMSKGLL